MIRRLLVAASIACPALPALAPVGGRAGGIAQAQAVSPSPTVTPPSDSLKVVLLGTGAGPPVNLQQYGMSTLIEAGGQRFLFDCGRGATLRLAQAGVPVRSITRVFLTHLHSDHLLQLPDLLLAGWAGGQRAVPLEVWGPAGTRDMMDHLQQAFAFDIRMRRDVDEHLPAAGITVVSHEVTTDSVVFAERGVTVTAFLVDHGPVQPAFGYRVDYRGRSVVLSGDTRVSENLVRHAHGTDVLVHEVIDPELARNRPDRPSAAIIESIIAHHTTPAQAGEVFRRVAPRLAVYSHAPNSERILAQTRAVYAGPLQGPEDLLTILIGAHIEVLHHTPPTTTAEVRRAVDSANSRLQRWYAAGQADSVASLFAVDARQMPPNSAPLVGRDSIRAYWAATLPLGQWRFELGTDDLLAADSIAVERGHYRLTFTAGSKAPMPSFQDRGNYVVLWRREGDGVWRVVWDAPVSVLPPAGR